MTSTFRTATPLVLAVALAACASTGTNDTSTSSRSPGAAQGMTAGSTSSSGTSGWSSTAGSTTAGTSGSTSAGTSGSSSATSGDAMRGSTSAAGMGTTAGTGASTAANTGAASVGVAAGAGISADQAAGLGMGTGGTAAVGAAGQAQAGAAAAIVPRSAAEALALVALVDQHELRLAQQARSKGVTGPALEYARMMEAHHGPHLTKTQALIKTAGTAPSGSTGVATLTAMSQQAEQQLAALQGEAYARAYIDRMVLDHQMALQMVNASMGVAKDAAVRTHLTATRQTMQTHLDRARALQRQLAR